jgi:hypothetical protein
MANFIYSFDTGLYDIANSAAQGYPYGSGPVPIKNTTGFTNTKTGNIYAAADGITFVEALRSPLSDGNAGMEFLTGGRLKDGATIIGALYNFRTTATGNASEPITAAPLYYHIFQLPEHDDSDFLHQPIMRISSGYHGDPIALVTDDNRTIIYTIDHKGEGNADVMQPVAGLSGYNMAVGPNLRRKVALGYA